MSATAVHGSAHMDPCRSGGLHGLPHHPPMHSSAPSASNSMLSIVQDHWMDVCSFFGEAQCAVSAEERAAMAQRLPKVEHDLNLILDALVTERRRVGVVTKAPLLSLGQVSSIAALHGEATSTAGSLPSPSSLASPSVSPARANDDGQVSNSPTSSMLQGNLVNQLPPCYYYLFAEDPRSPSSPPSDLERVSATTSGNANATKSPLSPQLAPPAPLHPTVKAPVADAHTLLHPVPVGTTFLFLLCQYAKLNEPAGARQIILRFLTRLLKDTDLPSRRVTTGFTDGRGKQARSLLQLFPASSIVPLLDLIRTLGRELDPSQYAAKRQRTAVVPAHAPPSQAASDDAERRELVLLLCELAEKAERIPELANYFVSEKASAAANTDTDSGRPQAHTSELLETLLPYLTHDCSAPGWEHRRDTCRYALSAALSLAKCPDPWVQDMVGAEQRLATHTLSGARVTLLTLCKIPDNDDSGMQLLYLRDVLRFWSAVHLTSPAVSHGLGLPAMIEKDFVRTTVLPLLQSADKRVYAAACLVVASALADLNSSGTLVSEVLVTALLATRVGAASGVLVHKGLEPEDGGQTVSFYEHYCLCHVSGHPTLSADDRAMMQALGYKISVWTAMEATLVLTTAIATHCPHLFLRHALGADPTSLASTVIPRLNARAAAPSVENAHGDERAVQPHRPLSAGDSAPHIRLGECFCPKLHLASDSLFGLSPDDVGEEVLQRMLTIESNYPVSALLATPLFMHSDEATLHGQVASSSAAHTTPPVESTDPSMIAGAGNIWFDQNIHQSPVVVTLCDVLKHAQPLPLSAKLLLSGALVVLCAIPDLRVLYTLLDPEYGRLDHALQALRAMLEIDMEEDDEVMSALGAAAAAVAEDTASLNVTKYKDRAAAAEVKARSGSRERSPSASTSTTRKESQGALVHELVSLTGALYTRQHVYTVFASHWNGFATDNIDDAPENLEVNEALRRAVAEHHEFLNTCAWLELLRMELDATVGYTSLSHNLLTLQP